MFCANISASLPPGLSNLGVILICCVSFLWLCSTNVDCGCLANRTGNWDATSVSGGRILRIPSCILTVTTACRNEDCKPHRQASTLSGANGTTKFRSPKTHTADTANTPYTGHTNASKIGSKASLHAQTLGNTTLCNQNCFFGVAIEILFSPQNRLLLTRLNTGYTHGFWTASGIFPSLSRSIDASPMWRALFRWMQTTNNTH